MRHLFPTLFFLLVTLWLPAQTWTLSWSDEFNGTAIDNNKWGYDIGTGAAQGLWGWGNGELQYYTDDNDNADVINGNLVITARQENFAGSNYTSARMVTRNKFSQTYGKWEARIDLPTGQGIWPAFWMLRENNPWPGEIDIMELVGHLPGNCHGTAHWGEVGNVQSMGGTITAPDWTTAFHVYTVEWWPDHIRWSVDGQVYFELDRTQVTPANPWLFAEDYHMLLNVAVGGQWPGSPDATTVFPQEMKVDWVRVYEHVPEPQPITFRVDLSEEPMGPGDQVYVTGSFDGWTGNTHALTDGGNGIWSTTLDLPQGIHEYKFTINGWTGSEESFSPGAEGTLTSYGDNGQTFVNRYVDVAWAGIVTDADCFSSPEGCPGSGGTGCTDPDATNYSVAATVNDGSCTYEVTFRVDLNEESVPGHTAYVNGGFNGWCGECDPMFDPEGDGVWERTIILPIGSHEFKFTTNGWAGLIEEFAVGTACTNTTYDGPTVYTNRLFEVTSSPIDLGTVCFNSCDACTPVEPTYHQATFRVQMPDPSLEAVLEVNGVEYAMAEAMWGAKEVTVTVPGGQPFSYRFGTPAGALGTAWETAPSPCGSAGMRLATIGSDATMDLVCFGECSACQGCADPFAANFDPLADPNSPDSFCTGLAEAGCTYEGATNYSVTAQWDDGSCAFASSPQDCPDNNGDGLIGVGDVLILLSAFGDTCD